MTRSAYPDNDIIYMILFGELILINYKSILFYSILFSSQFHIDLVRESDNLSGELLC